MLASTPNPSLLSLVAILTKDFFDKCFVFEMDTSLSIQPSINQQQITNKNNI